MSEVVKYLNYEPKFHSESLNSIYHKILNKYNDKVKAGQYTIILKNTFASDILSLCSDETIYEWCNDIDEMLKDEEKYKRLRPIYHELYSKYRKIKKDIVCDNIYVKIFNKYNDKDKAGKYTGILYDSCKCNKLMLINKNDELLDEYCEEISKVLADKDIICNNIYDKLFNKYNDEDKAGKYTGILFE